MRWYHKWCHVQTRAAQSHDVPSGTAEPARVSAVADAVGEGIGVKPCCCPPVGVVTAVAAARGVEAAEGLALDDVTTVSEGRPGAPAPALAVLPVAAGACNASERLVMRWSMDCPETLLARWNRG